MAARLEADRNGHAGEIGRGSDRRVRGHEDSGWRYGIGIGVEFGMSVRSRHIHGPMTSAAHIGLASLFNALEGAAVSRVVMLSLGGTDQFTKFVVESLVFEIAFLLSNPFLQAEVRFDDELAHDDRSFAIDAPVRCGACTLSRGRRWRHGGVATAEMNGSSRGDAGKPTKLKFWSCASRAVPAPRDQPASFRLVG